jgi:hypothetical protein
MTATCDPLMLFYAGAQGLGQNLNAANFTALAERLGSSYQNANGYPGNSYIAPRHHDANDTYRLLHWDPSCTNGYDPNSSNGKSSGCWKLNSRAAYRSPEV